MQRVVVIRPASQAQAAEPRVNPEAGCRRKAILPRADAATVMVRNARMLHGLRPPAHSIFAGWVQSIICQVELESSRTGAADLELRHHAPAGCK
ncbi:MAG: hypothetical protein ABI671_21725 [Burkholderiales bacterium]